MSQVCHNSYALELTFAHSIYSALTATALYRTFPSSSLANASLRPSAVISNSSTQGLIPCLLAKSSILIWFSRLASVEAMS